MPRRVHVHVGAPKSGTTYLQSRLHVNRRELARHGVGYRVGALGESRAHYWAALDLTGTDHGVAPHRVRGTWERLVRRVGRARGDVVISHEVLARATPDQARRAIGGLEGSGAEVHVVMTARDLARELTSGWQETLKFGGRRRLATFLSSAREGRSAFMDGFDPTRVLTVWGEEAGLPDERIHLVTSPPSGGAPDLLWNRFADAIGADPSWAPREVARANESVGIAEAQLLLELNRKLGEPVRRGGEYSRLLESVVVRDALAPRAAQRISLGPAEHPWVAERSEEWIRWLAGRGVRVHGDLADLRPGPPGEDWVDPDAPVPQQVAEAAVDAVAVLLSEAHDRGRARSSVRRARGALERLAR